MKKNQSVLNNKTSNEPVEEGKVAKAIESKTKYVPSDLFLWTAAGAIGASLTLQLMGKKEVSTFVGQWVPTVLILGLYNKLVKVAGSDQMKKRGGNSELMSDEFIAA